MAIVFIVVMPMVVTINVMVFIVVMPMGCNGQCLCNDHGVVTVTKRP